MAFSLAADAAPSPSHGLTHVADDGKSPRMVDVGSKAATRREATASCLVRLPVETLAALGCGAEGSGRPEVSALASKKGPILTTAVIAGVMAAKMTSGLIPFCHPLPLDGADVHVAWAAPDTLRVTCVARVTHKTGTVSRSFGVHSYLVIYQSSSYVTCIGTFFALLQPSALEVRRAFYHSGSLFL